MSSASSTPATAEEEAAAAAEAAAAGPSVLQGRELEWARNSPALEQAHKAANGSLVRTRFPPEPNGYLHIGHAKSMNMNFRLAFDKLGVEPANRRTIFRYDDTNPEAETKEYIDSIYQDLRWLGWEPERTTYSSDNFDQLYQFAIQLIHKGLAYVCDMTGAEIKAQRELALNRANCRNSGRDPDSEFPLVEALLPGRNRNTSVERNLELFEKMKLGCFDEGTYTLRLKMDFESSNPNMYDLIAYRIKYTPHPHAGSGWCIYPAYDFTHGICDSLEHIDYSICTLEFESRREPYYWILWALDLYRPKVYEMSRLNVQGTVLSKRKLIGLVQEKFVRGWDDCRMPTVSGLRRRGYTAKIINQFCQDIGATRAANVVEVKKLEQTARVILSDESQRVMAALDPIKVVITNFDQVCGNGATLTFEVANSPTNEALGVHSVTLTSTIYLDSSDFRLEDDPDYFGLAPNKAVGLKYHGGNLVCDKVVMMDANGNGNGGSSDSKRIQLLECHLDVSESRPKPKSYLSWVPSNGLTCEVRVYNPLFLVPEPSASWMEELNPESEIVYENAMVDPSVAELIDGRTVSKWKSNPSFQFERMGYFVVDYETTFNSETNKDGKIVLNRTVSLKEEGPRKKMTVTEQTQLEDRRTGTKAAMEAKERRMQIDAVNLFREWDEFKGKFSKYDDKGIPTHDADGTELTKSAVKKLIKEQQKHVKQQMAWKKGSTE
ncbi:hypothetical protein ACA910_016418 [Epithemia clementina (nom. ined.)]